MCQNVLHWWFWTVQSEMLLLQYYLEETIKKMSSRYFIHKIQAVWWQDASITRPILTFNCLRLLAVDNANNLLGRCSINYADGFFKWVSLKTSNFIGASAAIFMLFWLDISEMSPLSVSWITPTQIFFHMPGPCITNVFATCRKNFSQWESSFLWKLRCHWLKFLRRVAKTLVIQGPGKSTVMKCYLVLKAKDIGVNYF